MKAVFNSEKDELLIQQEVIYYNKSNVSLNEIYFHNWPNSFKDRYTPLGKRFVKNFRKDLFFAKEEDLGFSKINNLSINYKEINYEVLAGQKDIIKVPLETPLQPRDSVTISATYLVKIPNAKFTKYGKTKEGYHLRYWYLTPAVYKKGWQLMSNLNLDDLFENPTDFKIEISIPKNFVLESNIYQYLTKTTDKKNYYLVAKNKSDIYLSINTSKKLKTFKTKEINIYTDVIPKTLNYEETTNILSKELRFIKKYLGNYPHKEIYIDDITQKKDPIYGLSQLPDFIQPFPKDFNWEITMFKALAKKYIQNTLFLNKRKDYWLLDGILNYLKIEYLETFYPNTKLLGKYADNWFLKSYNLSKLDFNDKYPLAYQYISRKFLDQALTTPVDSLSNFNKKVVNKYKAGLGFRYLKDYLGDSILNRSLEEFYQKNALQISSSKNFREILQTNTSKNLDWFFEEFVNTNKKIDHTIDEIVKENDSLKVTVRNKRNTTSPISLYALKGKEIKYKKWYDNVRNKKEITIPNGDYDRIALNYENLYPEHNTLDNFKSLKKKIFNKPLKFTLIKDVQDPSYNQLFYRPQVLYNFYNGLILGTEIANKPLIKRNLEFGITPLYATKSRTFLGSFNVLYNQYFEDTKIYKIAYGVSGRTLDYAPNLAYRSFIPYINLEFKRKNLRDATYQGFTAKLVNIDKEIPEGQVITPEDRYTVFNLSYNYVNPDIIKEIRYRYSFEYAKDFSKISADIRFRSLTDSNTQLDFRLFAGAFLNNNTTGNYFSFGLDRANDYLFELRYFGRSEASGLFSQQFIIAEGGFKSVLPTRFANDYMVSFNSSIGLWRWVELYNDVAFLKSANNPLYFAYNSGIRFNFVHNILEVYFPFYSNNGWEIAQNNYAERIRFTFTADLRAIFNFVRRGVF